MIESDDLLFNPGWFGAEEKTIFFLANEPNQPIINLNKSVIASVGFSLNKSVVSHSRAIYNFLDFLGDIGGLSDAL